VTVAKIGTGLTDEEWRELKAKSQILKVKEKPGGYSIDKTMDCDVWIEPKIVVEIRADEITVFPDSHGRFGFAISKAGTI